LDNNLNIRQ